MNHTSRRRLAQALIATTAALALGPVNAQDVKRAKLGHSFTDSHRAPRR